MSCKPFDSFFTPSDWTRCDCTAASIRKRQKAAGEPGILASLLCAQSTGKCCYKQMFTCLPVSQLHYLSHGISISMADKAIKNVVKMLSIYYRLGFSWPQLLEFSVIHWLAGD